MNDPHAIAGHRLAIDEETQLLVIGAGPAGLAAAIEARRLGLQVVLVDENPVLAETMGDDIPLHFGGRMTGAIRNRSAMLEAVLDSDPAITVAFDAGVDIRLGVAAWGLYDNDRSVGWLPGLVVGLAEPGRSWMIRADHVIVASGSRDIGLAFLGWELPGVMGAVAAMRLIGLYGGVSTRRVVMLGTTVESFACARQLMASGVEIVAVVEQAPSPVHPGPWPGLLTGHAIRSATGTLEVEAVTVGQVGADGRSLIGTERSFECDTVVIGIGAVPQVELLDAHQCRLAFQPARGGYAPVLAGTGTSRGVVHAVGDCAGIWPEKTISRTIAEAEGRAAAAAIAGLPVPALDGPRLARDIASERLAWVRASVVEAAGEPHVCQCEAVTARELLEVRPPRYLDWHTERRNDRSLRALLGAGPPNPDQVKRLTRAGMGLCQGRRCREQVAALLALGAGVGLDEIALASHRSPVRPLPLSTIAAAETAELRAGWDTWFGMNSQYAPPWDVTGRYTVAGRRLGDETASE